MRVQSVGSNNYSKNNCSKYQAFQAHVYSCLELPPECKGGLCTIKKIENGIAYPYNLWKTIGAFLEPAIIKGFVERWYLLCGKKGTKLELLLADKKVPGVEDIIRNTPKTAMQQLKNAEGTIEMPLTVNFEDVCPVKNGDHEKSIMVHINNLKDYIFIL